MKRRSRPLNIVMALILAVALIPGGEITVYASGTAEEIISEIPDETEGETTADYNVVEKSNDISVLKAVIEPKEYTGSGISISPSDIKWMQGKREVYVAPTDITIESYKNNIKPGTATVTVRGSGKLAGTKKIKFKIRKRGFRWWWER